jgi:hypothetical protein
MPHTIQDGQPFPMPCPICKATAGMPFMAGTQLESGAIKVAMRCRDCGHEWRYDMPVAPDPKGDSGSHPVAKP